MKGGIHEKNSVIVFPKAGEAVLEETEIPGLGEDQILIRTRVSMISTGTELTAFCGEFPADSTWAKFFHCPYYPGYNNIGDVVAVGSERNRHMLGQRVATNGNHAAYVIQTLQPDANDGYTQARGRTEYFPVPETLTDEEAVFFVIPQIVMNGIRASKINWGECAVIFGAGLLGQFAARFCRQCGAFPVIVADVAENRLKFLPEDDPWIIPVNPAREKLAEVVTNHNHGRMADAVFEITGSAALLEQELSMLRPKGRLVILSSTKDRVSFDFHDFCVWKSFSIIGCHNFSHPEFPQPDNPWTVERHVEMYFDLVASRRLAVEPLISRVVDFRRAPEVLRRAVLGQGMRPGRKLCSGVCFPPSAGY